MKRKTLDEQRLHNIQEALRQKGQQGIDGWLFCDFRGSDPLAYRILGLDSAAISTRRWYYFIPAHGEPAGIVSSVEPHRLDSLPGHKRVFLSWQQLHECLAETRDERRVLPSTCFSIEPGIYLAGEFGVRSEVNVYITESDVIVTGEPMQTEVMPILP